MNMQKQRIYIDTSVIGGCFDEEFQEWSNKLFDDFINGKRIAVISDLTIAELNRASKEVSGKLLQLPEENVEYILRNEESNYLASKYIENGALSNKYYEDAHHIALATINNTNILVSWNFKHIVNMSRITIYNSVNILLNYKTMEIRSPMEVVEYED
ncbi:MAG: PIN domain protein [Bacteroidetes bacterium]|nr:PIN domain protein [Bacteroidota bacterium]